MRDFEHQYWKRRVLIKFTESRAVCWDNAETIEDAKDITDTYPWTLWQELPFEEIVELTFEQISKGEGGRSATTFIKD